MENKTVNLYNSFVLTIVFLGLSNLAYGFGEKGSDLRILHPTATGVSETCLVPRHYAPAMNPREVEDREDEVKLCRLNVGPIVGPSIMENMATGTQTTLDKVKEAAVCPKLNSTNPGTNFLKIPKGWTREQVEQKLCSRTAAEDPATADAVDVEAKFKSSITCSYTPSALASYHISRFLGGIGRVPVIVARTFDRVRHEGIIARANETLGASQEQIAVAWRTWSSETKNAASGRANPKLYVDDGAMVYGSLQKNLKGEDKYTDVSGVGEYATRYERFLDQTPFLHVANGDSLTRVVGTDDFAAVVPNLIQMQDVSDMVLLDSLLSQTDRIGNIHVKLQVIERDASGNVTSRKLTDDEEAEVKRLMALAPTKLARKKITAQIAARVSKKFFPNGDKVVVRVMHLKDNDCGVDVEAKPLGLRNKMRMVKALEKVRHMNPETYRRFLLLADEILSDRFKGFAQETLMYRKNDYEGTPTSLKENTRYALQTLKSACKSGELKLDLTLTFNSAGDWVPGPPVSCD